MQLNPARGRKLSCPHPSATYRPWVYAAQPREGTETPAERHIPSLHTWFMQLNPARGRKLDYLGASLGIPLLGLCSSTPRGDGNRKTMQLVNLTPQVYAAQPREGTET